MNDILEQPKPPALSAIIILLSDFESSRQLLRYLGQQTIRTQIELVLVTPDKSQLKLAEDLLALFWGYQVIEIGPFESINRARAAGILGARAALVVLTEDHCFPARGWAEALVNAHQNEWAGVGPTFGPMNRHTYPVWAMFLIQYGRWVKPTPSGIMPDIAGHNSSYKKGVLLQYGPDLEKMLEFEYALPQDLQKRGYQLFMEAKAETFHFPSI